MKLYLVVAVGCVFVVRAEDAAQAAAVMLAEFGPEKWTPARAARLEELPAEGEPGIVTDVTL